MHCRSKLGDLEQGALLNAKPMEADERVSEVLGAPYPENKENRQKLYTVHDFL